MFLLLEFFFKLPDPLLEEIGDDELPGFRNKLSIFDFFFSDRKEIYFYEKKINKMNNNSTHTGEGVREQKLNSCGGE